MPTNEINWSPTINAAASNDDAWNISGARKLDGSKDGGVQTPIRIGSSGGFSAPPTIAQLNASLGMNQLIGYYNRRAAIWNAANGGSLPIMSYLGSSDIYPATSLLATLKSNIAALRSAEGMLSGSLAWPNTAPTVGQPFFGDHVAYLRKSLAIATLRATLSGNGFTNRYSSSGGAFSLATVGPAVSGSPGAIGTRTTTNPQTATVRRWIRTYTSVAADVGTRLYLQATTSAVNAGENPVDVFVATPAVAESFAPSGLTYIGSVPAALGSYSFDTGFTVGSAGTTYSFHLRMQQDDSTSGLLVYTGGNFNFTMGLALSLYVY